MAADPKTDNQDPAAANETGGDGQDDDIVKTPGQAQQQHSQNQPMQPQVQQGQASHQAPAQGSPVKSEFEQWFKDNGNDFKGFEDIQREYDNFEDLAFAYDKNDRKQFLKDCKINENSTVAERKCVIKLFKTLDNYRQNKQSNGT